MVSITAPLSPKSLGGAQIAGNESKQYHFFKSKRGTDMDNVKEPNLIIEQYF